MARTVELGMEIYERSGHIMAKTGVIGGGHELGGMRVFVESKRLPRYIPNRRALEDLGKTLRETVMRHCRTCGEWWPATPAFWHKNRYSPDGLHSKCWQCRQQERQKRWRNIKK